MMRHNRGVIVNIVSIAGRNGGSPGAGHYAAAKGGMIAFSKNMAKELAPDGIRVNSVSPGVIDTPFHEQFSTPEMMKSFVASIPMGRVGTAPEVAAVIAFLCSDASSYICGETIEVNGGSSCYKILPVRCARRVCGSAFLFADHDGQACEIPA